MEALQSPWISQRTRLRLITLTLAAISSLSVLIQPVHSEDRVFTSGSTDFDISDAIRLSDGETETWTGSGDIDDSIVRITNTGSSTETAALFQCNGASTISLSNLTLDLSQISDDNSISLSVTESLFDAYDSCRIELSNVAIANINGSVDLNALFSANGASATLLNVDDEQVRIQNVDVSSDLIRVSNNGSVSLSSTDFELIGVEQSEQWLSFYSGGGSVSLRQCSFDDGILITTQMSDAKGADNILSLRSLSLMGVAANQPSGLSIMGLNTESSVSVANVELDGAGIEIGMVPTLDSSDSVVDLDSQQLRLQDISITGSLDYSPLMFFDNDSEMISDLNNVSAMITEGSGGILRPMVSISNVSLQSVSGAPSLISSMLLPLTSEKYNGENTMYMSQSTVPRITVDSLSLEMSSLSDSVFYGSVSEGYLSAKTARSVTYNLYRKFVANAASVIAIRSFNSLSNLQSPLLVQSDGRLSQSEYFSDYLPRSTVFAFSKEASSMLDSEMLISDNSNTFTNQDCLIDVSYGGGLIINGDAQMPPVMSMSDLSNMDALICEHNSGVLQLQSLIVDDLLLFASNDGSSDRRDVWQAIGLFDNQTALVPNDNDNGVSDYIRNDPIVSLSEMMISNVTFMSNTISESSLGLYLYPTGLPVSIDSIVLEDCIFNGRSVIITPAVIYGNYIYELDDLNETEITDENDFFALSNSEKDSTNGLYISNVADLAALSDGNENSDYYYSVLFKSCEFSGFMMDVDSEPDLLVFYRQLSAPLMISNIIQDGNLTGLMLPSVNIQSSVFSDINSTNENVNTNITTMSVISISMDLSLNAFEWVDMPYLSNYYTWLYQTVLNEKPLYDSSNNDLYLVSLDEGCQFGVDSADFGSNVDQLITVVDYNAFTNLSSVYSTYQSARMQIGLDNIGVSLSSDNVYDSYDDWQFTNALIWHRYAFDAESEGIDNNDYFFMDRLFTGIRFQGSFGDSNDKLFSPLVSSKPLEYSFQTETMTEDVSFYCGLQQSSSFTSSLYTSVVVDGLSVDGVSVEDYSDSDDDSNGYTHDQPLLEVVCGSMTIVNSRFNDVTFAGSSSDWSSSDASLIELINSHFIMDESHFEDVWQTMSVVSAQFIPVQELLDDDDDDSVNDDSYSFQITNSDFFSCKSRFSAGAVFSMIGRTVLIVDESSNSVTKGISNLVNITVANFTDNRAGIENPNDNEDSGSLSGGAIYAESIGVSDEENIGILMDSVSLRNNFGSSGAGVYSLETSVMIKDSEIIGNEAAQYGGGVAVVSGLCFESAFDNETTQGEEFDISEVSASQIPHLSVESTVIRNNRGLYGGALFSSCSRVTITNNDEIDGNGATLSGDACERGGAVMLQHSCIRDVSDNTFVSNAALNGGAVAVSGGLFISDSCNNEITTSVFTENLGTRTGGAIYVTSGYIDTSQLDDFEMIDEATISLGFDKSWFDSVEQNSWELSISNCTFSLNQANLRGGAIAIGREWDSDSTAYYSNEQMYDRLIGVEFDNSSLLPESWKISIEDETLFSQNQLYFSGSLSTDEVTNDEGGGGAISWLISDGSQASLIVDSSRFANNKASEQGGALWTSCMKCTLVASSVGDGSSVSIEDSFALYYAQDSQSKCRNCISGNHHGYSDEGEMNELVIRGDTRFNENTCPIGGALSVSCVQSLRISDSVKFLRNEAEYHGGAVFSYGVGTLQITGDDESDDDESESYEGFSLVFDSNSAQLRGGAISHSCSMSTLNVTNVLFKGNEAEKNGGALMISDIQVLKSSNESSMSMNNDDPDSMTMDGCKFIENEAGISGGAVMYLATGQSGFEDKTDLFDPSSPDSANNMDDDLYWSKVGGDLTIFHSVFEENSAQLGGAIYVSTALDIIEVIDGAKSTDNEESVEVSSNIFIDGQSVNYQWTFEDPTRVASASDLPATKDGAQWDASRLMLYFISLNEEPTVADSDVYWRPVWDSTMRWWRDHVSIEDEEKVLSGKLDPFRSLPQVVFIQPDQADSEDDSLLASSLKLYNQMATTMKLELDDWADQMNPNPGQTESEYEFEFRLLGFLQDEWLHGFVTHATNDDNQGLKALRVSLNMQNVEFEKNDARSLGGAVLIDDEYGIVDGSLLDNCTWINNEAQDGAALSVVQNYLRRPMKELNGPADWARQTVINGGIAATLQNDTIIHQLGRSTITVSNSMFESNDARDSGGAMIVQDSNLVITSTGFHLNTAQSGGGAIFMHGGKLNVYDSINNNIELNSNVTNLSEQNNNNSVSLNDTNATLIDSFNKYDTYFVECESGTDGGAIFTQYSTVSLANISGIQNRALRGKGGGMIHISSLAPFVFNSSGVFEYWRMVDNETEETYNQYLVTMQGCQLENNLADRSGGALYIDSNYDPYTLCSGETCVSDSRRRALEFFDASDEQFHMKKRERRRRLLNQQQQQQQYRPQEWDRESLAQLSDDKRRRRLRQMALPVNDYRMVSDVDSSYSSVINDIQFESMFQRRLLSEDDTIGLFDSFSSTEVDDDAELDTTSTEQPLSTTEEETTTDEIESEVYCVKIVVDSDMHEEDLSWQISDDNGTVLLDGLVSEGLPDCANFTSDEDGDLIECLEVTLIDSFGDGLNHGQGSWYVTYGPIVNGSRNNDRLQRFDSPSQGQFARNETIRMCPEYIVQSAEQSRSMGLLLDINSEVSLDFLTTFERDLRDAFDNRLNINELIFINIYEGKAGVDSKEYCIRNFQYCSFSKDSTIAIYTTLALQCIWQVTWEFTHYTTDEPVSSLNETFPDWPHLFLVDSDEWTDEDSYNYALEVLDGYCGDYLPLDWRSDGSGRGTSDVYGLQVSSNWRAKSGDATFTANPPSIYFFPGLMIDAFEFRDQLYIYQNPNPDREWSSLWIDPDLTTCEFNGVDPMIEAVCENVFDGDIGRNWYNWTQYNGTEVKKSDFEPSENGAVPMAQVPLLCQIESCDSYGCDAERISITYSSVSERFDQFGVDSEVFTVGDQYVSDLFVYGTGADFYEILDLRFTGVLGNLTYNFCFNDSGMTTVEELNSYLTWQPIGSDSSSSGNSNGNDNNVQSNGNIDDDLSLFGMNGASTTDEPNVELSSSQVESEQPTASPTMFPTLYPTETPEYYPLGPVNLTEFDSQGAFVYTTWDCPSHLLLVEWLQNYAGSRAVIFGYNVGTDDVLDTPAPLTPTPTEEAEEEKVQYLYTAAVNYTIHGMSYSEVFTQGSNERWILQQFSKNLDNSVPLSFENQRASQNNEDTLVTLTSVNGNTSELFENIDDPVFLQMYTLAVSRDLRLRYSEENFTMLNFDEDTLFKRQSTKTNQPTSSPSMAPTNAPTAPELWLPARVIQGDSGRHFAETLWQMRTLSYENPTPRPSPNPTRSPTLSPEFYSPTLSPTLRPTRIPTRNDTDEDSDPNNTPSPTIRPTRSPTLTPRNDMLVSFTCTTKAPTMAPTMSPVVTPASRNNNNQTEEPNEYNALFGYDESMLDSNTSSSITTSMTSNIDLRSGDLNPRDYLNWVAPLQRYVSDDQRFRSFLDSCDLGYRINQESDVIYAGVTTGWTHSRVFCMSFRGGILVPKTLISENTENSEKLDWYANFDNDDWNDLDFYDLEESETGLSCTTFDSIDDLIDTEYGISPVGSTCIFLQTGPSGDCSEGSCGIAIKPIAAVSGYDGAPQFDDEGEVVSQIGPSNLAKITDSYFTMNNVSDENGGSVAIISGDELYYPSFDDQVKDSSGRDGSLSGDYVGIEFEGCTFEENSAVNGNGGAIYKATANDDFPDSRNGDGTDNNLREYSQVAATLQLTDTVLNKNQAINGGGLFLDGSLRTPSYMWKSTAVVERTNFTNNRALDNPDLETEDTEGTTDALTGGGAGLYALWYNAKISQSWFSSNEAGNNGGGILLKESTMLLEQSLIEGNVANKNGGGFFKPLDKDDELELSYCMALFTTVIAGNRATLGRGGGMYLGLWGDEHEPTGQSCVSAMNMILSGNFAGSGGNDIFLDVREGKHDLQDPSPMLDLCDGDSEICARVQYGSVLQYLCVQDYDLTTRGFCDEFETTVNQSRFNGTVDDIEWDSLKDPLVFLRPGNSKLLAIFGWDIYGNRLNATDALTGQDIFSVRLEAVAPAVATDTVESSFRDVWIAPVFINRASKGDLANISIIDTNEIADTLVYNIEIVNCDFGYFQKPVNLTVGGESDKEEEDQNATLFACLQCDAGSYTLSTTECRLCEDGTTCEGEDDVRVDYLWYALESDKEKYEGYIATAICPVGYCCQSSDGCLMPDYPSNFSESTGNYSKPCSYGRNPAVPLCGECYDGLSETNAADGACGECNDNSGLTLALIIPFLVGFVTVGLWFKNGLIPKQPIPPAGLVYLSKTLLFFFQLLPSMTFQSPLKAFQPLAAFFNFQISIDDNDSEAGGCVMKHMTGLEKQWFGLVPGGIMIFCLACVTLGITRVSSFKEDPQARHNLSRAVEQSLWQISLFVYAAVATVTVKLLDCRTLTSTGDEPHFDSGSYMGYAGNHRCFATWHALPWCMCGCVALFPVVVFYGLRRVFYRPHIRLVQPGGWRGVRELFPALIMQYRRSAWWYPSWEILRKFIVVLVAAVSGESPQVTATYLCMVMALLLGVHVFVQPYYHRFNNYLESFVLFCAFGVCLFNVPPDPPKYYTLASLIVTVAPLAPVAFMVCELVYSKGPIALKIAPIKPAKTAEREKRWADVEKAEQELDEEMEQLQKEGTMNKKELEEYKSQKAAEIHERYDDAVDKGLKKVLPLPQFRSLKGKELHIIDRAARDRIELMEKLENGEGDNLDVYDQEFDENDSVSWSRITNESDSNPSFDHFEKFVKKEAQKHGDLYISLKDQGIDFKTLMKEGKDDKIPGLGTGPVILYDSSTENSEMIWLDNSSENTESSTSSWNVHDSDNDDSSKSSKNFSLSETTGPNGEANHDRTGTQGGTNSATNIFGRLKQAASRKDMFEMEGARTTSKKTIPLYASVKSQSSLKDVKTPSSKSTSEGTPMNNGEIQMTAQKSPVSPPQKKVKSTGFGLGKPQTSAMPYGSEMEDSDSGELKMDIELSPEERAGSAAAAATVALSPPNERVAHIQEEEDEPRDYRAGDMKDPMIRHTAHIAYDMAMDVLFAADYQNEDEDDDIDAMMPELSHSVHEIEPWERKGRIMAKVEKKTMLDTSSESTEDLFGNILDLSSTMRRKIDRLEELSDTGDDHPLKDYKPGKPLAVHIDGVGSDSLLGGPKSKHTAKSSTHGRFTTQAQLEEAATLDFDFEFDSDDEVMLAEEVAQHTKTQDQGYQQ